MNSNSEDFPVPVFPTRRMVYGLSFLFLDILMTPLLRDSTSLENTVRTDARTCRWCPLDGQYDIPIIGVGTVHFFLHVLA
jgi:hypothetical protein